MEISIRSLAVDIHSFRLCAVAKGAGSQSAAGRGYPGFTRRKDAMPFTAHHGDGNTAVGWYSLFTNTDRRL